MLLNLVKIAKAPNWSIKMLYPEDSCINLKLKLRSYALCKCKLF